MAVGIVNFGAYIPIHRLNKSIIGDMWGRPVRSSEKAVASWDEDSLTMAIESCLDSMAGCERDSVEGILFASTTPPFREKQSASIIRKVLDLRPEAFTTDISNSLRGGSIGLTLALNAIRANQSGKFLVVASDLRIAAPDSELELEFGDGAAALLLGDKDVVAAINQHYSISSEFIDAWRRDKDPYTQMWEDRFVLSEGYLKLMTQSIKEFLAQLNAHPGDFAKVALYAPNLRALKTLVRKVGFDYEKQIPSQVFDRVGNTGVALAFMMLAEALEKSKPGDRILLATYGDGVDLFDITVTENINDRTKGRGIEGHLASSTPLESYGKYLRFRDFMKWQYDRRPPDRTSLPIINRESNQIYSLYGCKCRKCGTIQYPIQRVCTQCQSKDDFEEIRLSDRKGTIFTFSKDERAMAPDLPNVLCIVDLEGGGRFYSVMTDRKPDSIKIGMPVEMTFRRIHEGLELYNYFWKTRPVRE
jgi:3-hydroxy-3-methylglutaryl CoA synthase